MAIKKFIRWAGGKQGIVKTLIEHLPADHEKLRLIEPFAGAASLFLNTNFRSAVLIDMNPHLIGAYKNIQTNFEDVYAELEKLKKKHSKEFYYEVREIFNQDPHDTITQSARFIYLVQSSYNGVYRVNTKGKYNVPFGKLNAYYPTLESLEFIHNKLQKAELYHTDFSMVFDIATRNDFVYFDPPYMPVSDTSNFQHYTDTRFPSEEQDKVADFAAELSLRGIDVMVSSSQTDYILELYKDWSIIPVGVIRYVSCKAVRETTSEIIIRNY